MQAPSKPMPIEPRGGSHYEGCRRPAGRGWLVVEGSGQPRPAPWSLPPGGLQQFAGSDLLKQVGPGASQQTYGPRFQPYGLRQRHMQFTVHDIDKYLYGKQELRVVQIGDQKVTPPAGGAGDLPARSANANTTSGSEDQKKPAKWCDMCQEVRFGECPQHGPLPSLRPSLVLPGPKSYAVSTFPDEVGLCISTLPLAGYGVFARHFIPMGTWIGPYEGKKIPVEDGLKQISQGDAPFLWEIYENFCLCHFLDASDENSSSWMRFIQCARHPGEQNLFGFQYYGSIYYRAFKDISVGSELLVWYDDKYPQYFGMPYGIRDMSSCSMESIQAPMEVSKLSDFDPNRPHHPEGGRRHPLGQFIHSGGKMIQTGGPPGRERNEPPRIPPNGHVHSQSMHGHVSSSFQAPPAQPPTLSQAPSIMDTRSAQSSVYLTNTRPQLHPSIPHGHSPRLTSINPAFRRETPYGSSSMLRSMSSEDLRKRNAPNVPVPDRSMLEREAVERGSDIVHHPPPPRLLAPPPPGSHYTSSAGFSRLAPAIMSVTPLHIDHSKAKAEDINKLREVKLFHERERIAHERAAAHEIRDRDLVLLRERPPHERVPLEGQVPLDWEVYRCQNCGQSFNQKSNLEKHHCVSEASKPFQCGRCQLSFQEADDLQEHMIMHTSDRPFKCGVCSRSFSAASALAAHMRMHVNVNINEQNQVPAKESSPLDCPKCGKRFIHAIDMTKHYQTPGECMG